MSNKCRSLLYTSVSISFAHLANSNVANIYENNNHSLVEIEFYTFKNYFFIKYFLKLRHVCLLKILKVDKLTLKIVDKNQVLKNCR